MKKYKQCPKRREKLSHQYKVSQLKRKYGLSVEDYIKMVEAQDNLCYICNNPETALKPKTETPKALAVDHCHKTGKVRKLLCTRCNQSLGRMEDSVDLLQAMIDYLNEHNS